MRTSRGILPAIRQERTLPSPPALHRMWGHDRTVARVDDARDALARLGGARPGLAAVARTEPRRSGRIVPRTRDVAADADQALERRGRPRLFHAARRRRPGFRLQPAG